MLKFSEKFKFNFPALASSPENFLPNAGILQDHRQPFPLPHIHHHQLEVWSLLRWRLLHPLLLLGWCSPPGERKRISLELILASDLSCGGIWTGDEFEIRARDLGMGRRVDLCWFRVGLHRRCRRWILNEKKLVRGFCKKNFDSRTSKNLIPLRAKHIGR